MERTQTDVIDTTFAQGDKIRNDIHNLCRVQYPVYGNLIYHSFSCESVFADTKVHIKKSPANKKVCRGSLNLAYIRDGSVTGEAHGRLLFPLIPLYIIDNGLFNLLPNLSQILFHSFRIFVLDNFEKILQLRADIGYLSRSAWVEQDFLKQIVVFA